LLNLDFGGFFLAGSYAFHDNGEDDDQSFMFGGGFSDFLFEGSELGAYYASIPSYGSEDDYMIEGYLGVPVNQFLTLTPAVVYGDLDEGDEENLYGVIRATFSF
jgi:hypothetical protein